MGIIKDYYNPQVKTVLGIDHERYTVVFSQIVRRGM